jgi:LPXTG-motif cell wall-anchored protein
MKAGIRISVATAFGLMVLFGAATPALAVTGPNLKVTASFDKASYYLGETAVFTATVVNDGDVTIHNVKITGSDTNLGLDIDLGDPLPAFNLDPGKSKDVVIPGKVNNKGMSDGFVGESVELRGDESEANGDDNIAAARAQVIGTTNLTGRVFDDGSGASVTPPGVAGATVVLTNDFNHAVTVSASSDGTGAFHIDSMPAGPYSVSTTLPAGWALSTGAPSKLLVTGSGEDELLIPAHRVAAPTTTPQPSAAPQLPSTGAPVRWIVAVGGAIVVLGVALLGLARRRRSTS